MTRAPIIQVRGLTAGYGNTAILDDLSFDVLTGEVFGLLGGSGCGKTTVLRHMMGLIPPLAGSVVIDGVDIVTAEGKARRAVLRKLGVMYQSGALFGSMTLIENVVLPLEEHTRLPARGRELVARLRLRLVGLQGFEGYLPAEISGGMRKRAAIARAMALDPRIIFLDEPSAGLDPVTSADLDHLILELAHALGITFVMVTHELPSIFATNDRALMLDKESRGILALGTPQELSANSHPTVARFFQRKSRTNGQPSHEENSP